MEHTVRVVAAIGNHGLGVVESGAAETAGDPFEIRFRRRVGRPLPGDRVKLDAAGAVAAIAPRSTVFGRGVRGRFRPIAANLDRLLIVIAPEPAPSRALLHRYIAAAGIQGVAAEVVVNKCDLPAPDVPPFDELDRIGVPVYRTRAAPPAALGGLADSFDSGIHMLAGQSGVGKTSLGNALVPDLRGQTEQLSRTTGKGRHTTTTTRLLRLPGGAWLVDTPGVWEYELWRMTPRELAGGFPEFAPLSARCRFRDCRHDGEPGCGVETAVENGELQAFRLQAWRALLAEQERLGSG